MVWRWDFYIQFTNISNYMCVGGVCLWILGLGAVFIGVGFIFMALVRALAKKTKQKFNHYRTCDSGNFYATFTPDSNIHYYYAYYENYIQYFYELDKLQLLADIYNIDIACLLNDL